jgi:tRNA threonylcarbamoyladenosine biosynthesis protein TsaB
MNILSIETSTDICSIALIIDGKCAEIIEESIPRQHAEVLPVFYNRLLVKRKFDLSDIESIAVSIGPGSFTGLRIGLSYSKGLAYSHSLPIIPVPTLSSLLYGCNSKNDKNIVIISSHKNIYYYQRFDSKSDTLSNIKTVELSIIDDLQDIDYFNIVQYGSEQLFTDSNLKYQTVNPSAQLIGELAYLNRNEWIVPEPYKLVPKYISPFKTNQ